MAERKGEIVGVNIAGILPNGEAWGAICKTRKELEGLHEAIILKMVQKINALDPTIQRINVGSDMGREGLRRFKESSNRFSISKDTGCTSNRRSHRSLISDLSGGAAWCERRSTG